MVIDGRHIARAVKDTVARDVQRLATREVYPHLAVLLVGDDPSSQAYVRQKKKVGAEVGIEVSVYLFPPDTSPQVILDHAKQLNVDASIHGVIIQRPLPIAIPTDILDGVVRPEKDVDGFHPTSPFTPPIVSAVLRILEWVHQDIRKQEPATEAFFQWLREKKIVVIGRGVTAGKPIADTLQKYAIPYSVVHSKTENGVELCLSADIIISCAGKQNIVRHSMLSSKTILIGVGLHTEDGHLAPDYDQNEVAGLVRYYTPVPGGVGPVNVACLLENVILAAEKQQKP